MKIYVVEYERYDLHWVDFVTTDINKLNNFIKDERLYDNCNHIVVGEDGCEEPIDEILIVEGLVVNND